MSFKQDGGGDGGSGLYIFATQINNKIVLAFVRLNSISFLHIVKTSRNNIFLLMEMLDHTLIMNNS